MSLFNRALVWLSVLLISTCVWALTTLAAFGALALLQGWRP